MLVGYWPPTNEMLRQFSINPAQNPGGWKGQNWEGRGYNVFSYFPEFPGGVDLNPKGNGDFEVDYQDTSADFWRITAEVKPVAIITFSRGRLGSNWEIEAGAKNHATWIDDYNTPFQPTPGKPDDSLPAEAVRRSTLPMNQILTNVRNAGLGINAFIDASNNVGSFLSEYLAYHGMWYQSLHASPSDPNFCAMGGHVHVGINTPTAAATTAAEITLRTAINAIPNPGTLPALSILALSGLARRRR
jgi:pyrrolidone-carboxylate peptidase